MDGFTGQNEPIFSKKAYFSARAPITFYCMEGICTRAQSKECAQTGDLNPTQNNQQRRHAIYAHTQTQMTYNSYLKFVKYFTL